MAKVQRALWFRSLLLALLSSMAWAQLPVTDDTYVSSAAPSTNNGNSPSLVVQAPGGWTLIKLDLSQLPLGTQSSAVTRATLKLYVTAATAQGSFDLYRVDTPWKEGTLTYSSSTTPYQSAQTLTFSLVNAGTACPSTNQCVTTASKYVIVDVTSIVKQWLDNQNGGGGFPNNGIALKPSSGSSISVTFDSKESTTSSHAPEIDFVLTPASFVSTLATTSPIANTGTPSSPNIALTGLIPSANLSGTYAITITGNANSATNSSMLGGLGPNQYAQLGAGSNTFTGSITASSFSGSGAGLTGITGTNVTNIPNSSLQHSSVTVAAGTGLSGGGPVGLGGSVTLNNAGVLSVGPGTGILLGGSTAQPIINNAGVLSVGASGVLSSSGGQNPSISLTGVIPTGNLPTTLVYNNQANSFTGGKQTLAASANAYSSLNVPSGTAPNTPAAGDVWLTSGDPHLQFRDASNNSQSLAFLADVNTANTNLQAAITAETAARQAADTTLQTNITAETNRATAAEATLTTNLSNETSARQAADTTLQTNVNTEAATRQAADTAEAAARILGDANTLASANTYTDNTKTNILTQPQTFSGNETLSGNNSFTGSNTFSGAKVDLSQALATLPVQTTTTAPPPSGQPNACATGQMVLYLNGPAGQQLYVCNSNRDGWVGINDESQLQASIIAEAATRAAADTTLQSNINAEAVTRTAADTTLQTNIIAETARAMGAETALGTSMSNEVTRATNAENTLTNSKANLAGGNTFSGGSQMLAPSAAGYASINVPNTGAAPSSPLSGDVWLTTGDAHLQFRDMNNVTQMLAFSSDVNTANTNLQNAINAETAARQAADTAESNRATAAEATLTTNLSNETSARQAADTTLQTNINNETSARQAADTTLQTNINTEAVTRAAADTSLQNNINAETARAMGAETALINSKANLAGGNLFTGGSQVLAPSAAGYASINVPNTGAAPSSPLSGDVWLTTGDIHLQFRDKNSTTQSLAFYSDVTTANNAVTTSLNAEIARATAAEGVLTTNLSNEVTRATGAEATLTTHLSNEISRAQAAETAETNRATAAEGVLSSGLASEITRATGVEASLNTAISTETTRATNAENTLSNSKANLAGGNLFTGGSQVLAASAAGYASFNVPNSSTPPTTPGVGDVWLTNADSHLQFQDKTNITQSLAFSSDVTAATNNSTAALNAEVTRATGAEATLTTHLSNEISRAQAAETAETNRATAAEGVLSSGLASEITRATGAESTLTTNLSAEVTRATGAETALTNSKANLAGGNSFTGNQTVNGRLSLPAAAAGNSQPSNLLQLNATDGSGNSQSAQLQTLANGGLSFQFGPTGSASQKLSIDNSGLITFAAGQTFPGTQSALTAGSGISILSNTISNTGVLSTTAGTGISITGTAANPTVSNTGVLSVAGDGTVVTSTGGQTPVIAITGIVPIAHGGTGSSTQNFVDLTTNQSVAGNKTFTGLFTTADATINQKADGDDALSGKRFTDSTPTGNLMRFRNAANSTDLWRVDASGVLQAGSVPGAQVTGNISGNAASITGTITGAQVTGNISGNASTATALAAVPTQCGANNFATGIAANGNANCTQPSAGNLSNGTSGSGAVVLATSPSVSSPTMTNAVVNQAANNTDAVSGKRFTDSSPTGNFERFTNNTGSTDLWKVDVTGTLTAGSIPDGRLSANVPLLNQANTYGAGKKQTLVASATLAGLSFDGGVATDPSTLASGDTWFNNSSNHLRFFDGSTTKSLAFTTDIAAGTVTTGVTLNSGQLIVGNGSSTIGVGNLTGDVTTSGSTATTLAASGVTAGTYTKVTVDAKGRTTVGATASAGDLSNGTSGSGAIALATSPALAGTPTAPTAAAGNNTTQIATTAFVQSAVSTASVFFLKDSSNGNFPNNKASAWIGNNSTGDGTGTETTFEFLMGETLTLAKFFCKVSANIGASQSVTFQVFDGSGSAVSGLTCVIPASSSSGTASGTFVTLNANTLYAVKATVSSGNLNGLSGWWAIGQ